MINTENNYAGVDRLAHLLGMGRTIFIRHFPDYKGRDTDIGYLELFIQCNAYPSRSHDKWFYRWRNEVAKVLKEQIKDDYYLDLFKSVRMPNNIMLLAPDGYLHYLTALQKIVGDLKKIRLSRENIKLVDDHEKLTAYFDYNDPYLILVFEEIDEQYEVYKFRKGKPKTLLEHALKSSDGTARKSEFRLGNPHRPPIRGSFFEIFNHLLNDQKFEKVPIKRFIPVLSPSHIKISRDPFIVNRVDYRVIANELKKSKYA